MPQLMATRFRGRYLRRKSRLWRSSLHETTSSVQCLTRGIRGDRFEDWPLTQFDRNAWQTDRRIRAQARSRSNCLLGLGPGDNFTCNPCQCQSSESIMNILTHHLPPGFHPHHVETSFRTCQGHPKTGGLLVLAPTSRPGA
jgi:hypothetical protein